jgi:hypothetical protein
MPLCSLVGGYQRFGGTYCYHVLGRSSLKMEATCSSKMLVTTYGVITNKTTIQKFHYGENLKSNTSFFNNSESNKEGNENIPKAYLSNCFVSF